ncbi:MAG: hypothetical protein PHD76_05380 [Methylacidiphilales bacterium]|nr:hypothetical protein [Candidatus Methylacidiphilales bacterium]
MPARFHAPRSFFCLWITLCSLQLLCLAAHAQTNPSEPWDDGYRRFQDYAPEYLEIKVTHVETRQSNGFFSGAKTNVSIEAQVQRVFRSASGLQPGGTILIHYTRKATAGSADLNPPIPEENKIVPAFLRKSGALYEPAAYHHSFSPLTARQVEALEKNLMASQAERKRQEEIHAQKLIVLLEAQKKAEAEAASREEASHRETAGATPPKPATEPVIQTSPEPAPTPPVTDLPSASPPPPPSAPSVARNEPDTSSIEMEALPQKSAPPPAPAISSETKPESPPTPPAPEPPEPTVVQAEPATPTPEPPVPAAAPVIKTPDETAPPAPPAPEKQEAPVAVVQAEPKAAEPAPAQPAPTPPVPANEPEPIKITEVQPSPAAPPAETKQPETQPPPQTPSKAETNLQGMDSYAAIYSLMQEADAARTRNDNTNAKEIYQKALTQLQQLQQKQPDFQPFIVEYRLKYLQAKIDDLSKKITDSPSAAPSPTPAVK